MEKTAAHIRNPFAGAVDEKAVWKQLMENARSVSKEEFFEKARQARQLRKDA